MQNKGAMISALILSACITHFSEESPIQQIVMCDNYFEGQNTVKLSLGCEQLNCDAFKAFKNSKTIQIPDSDACEQSHEYYELCELSGGENVQTRIYDKSWYSEDLCRFKDGSYIDVIELWIANRSNNKCK